MWRWGGVWGGERKIWGIGEMGACGKRVSGERGGAGAHGKVLEPVEAACVVLLELRVARAELQIPAHPCRVCDDAHLCQDAPIDEWTSDA